MCSSDLCQSLRRLFNIAEDFRADGLGGEVGEGVAGLPWFADDFGDEQAVAGAAADVFDFGLDDADVDAEAFG